MPGPYDLTRQDLAAELGDQPPYRVTQVWEGLHRRARLPEEMTELPVDLRMRLAADHPAALRPSARRTADAGQTVKWVWSLSDGATIETVLMHYRRRTTVCVSTQAGCAMACQFCATGQAGFQRNLSVGEIVEQVVMAVREARPRRVSNVVFMGMGEPLANFDRTWGAVERLHEDIGISARHLTLSTVGVVPGIRRLAQSGLPVNLAVSLHAANDELRASLVPIGRRYPLAELAQACRDYVDATGRRLSLEWALIDAVNDRPADAGELARFAAPLGAHVNLIPLNATPGYAVRGSPPQRIARFAASLRSLGITATVRATRGSEIDAACGQLAAGGRVRGAPVSLRSPVPVHPGHP